MIRNLALVLVTAAAVASPSAGVAQDQKPAEVNATTTREINDFFEQLQKYLRDGDEKGMVTLVDVERFLDVVTAKLKKFKFDKALRERVTPQMQSRLTEIFLFDNSSWDRFHIVNIDAIREGELRVVVRHWDTSGSTLRFRLWFLRRNDKWTIYDIQDFNLGIRVSDTVILLLEQLAEIKAKQKLIPVIQKYQAMVLAVQQFDFDSIREPFEDLKNTNITEFMDGFKWLIGALLATYDEDSHLILKYLELAEKNKLKTPVANYLRAVAYNLLEEPESALKHAQQYITEFGIDPATLLEIGIAYEQLGQPEKAIAQYRKALDDTPDSWDNLAALGVTLDDNQKSEIAVRFARFNHPIENFEAIAEEFASAQDAQALDALIFEYKKKHADDPDIKYYSALASYFRKDYVKAAEIVRSAFAAVKGEEDEPYYHELYFDCMIALKKVVAAYQMAPNKEVGFRYLCDELISVDDYDSVLQLVGARRVDSPKSPHVEFYIGEVHFYRDKFEEADASYATAGTLDTEGKLKEPVRQSRVACWYHLGKGEQAYEKFIPKQLTFEQLGWLAEGESDFELLGKLLDKHETESRTPLCAFFRSTIAWKNKNYEEVPKLLEGHLTHYFETFEAEDAVRAEDYAIRSRIRINDFELAYRLAQKSSKRDGDPFYEAVVLGVRGNAAECEKVVDQCLRLGYEPDEFLSDKDLGPALNSIEANKKLNAKLEALTNAAKETQPKSE